MRKHEDLPLVQTLHPFKQCGATSKRSGLPCVQPAMKNGRCRFHGGKSTGPKTVEGKQAQRQGNLRHGYYSIASQIERLQAKLLMQGIHEA
jgi:hypothetical protein